MLTTLATLVASFASGEAARAVGRFRRTALAYAAAALFCLIGAGFLVGAGFVALADRLGTVPAALWFGGGFILLAVLIVTVNAISAKAAARRAAERRRVDAGTLAGAAAIAALPALLASRRGMGGLLGPVIAAAAYAIYRENTRLRHPDLPE